MIATPATQSAKVFTVGTLSYTKASLSLLFCWLLSGDFVYIIIQQIEPRVLPLLLRQYGATDKQIAIIVSSLPALINFLVNPIVSYRSDRKRSRWGRRIPYLLVATPFVSISLALTPFAPEFSRFATSLRWLEPIFRISPWAPVVLIFGLLVVFYQCAQLVVTPIYIYLFRDVVPMQFMGRFLALMRVFSALGTFAVNYWLVGLVGTHAKAIFIGVAGLNLIGFLTVCWFVREGAYPPPSETGIAGTGIGRSALLQSSRIFITESFTSRVYWWTFITRLLIYATIPMSAFLIFFAQYEVGLTADRAGKLLAWPSLAWLVVAYPIGILMDRWRAIRTLTPALWISAVGYTLSFLFVVGERTFFVSSMVTGIVYWMVMLAQLMLAQEIFEKERMGQLCAANTMVQSLVIAFITGPLTGWLLSALHGRQLYWHVPFIGMTEIGPYRFIYLLLAMVFFASLFSLYRLKAHLSRSGGQVRYGR
jgi:maltose/moltooligosaccharide transporter